MAEFPKWYQVYLTAWFVVAVTGVTWQALKGNLEPAQTLFVEAALATVMVMVVAAIRRAWRGPRE
jgi:hypothetical protein